jgi:NADH dehydrogenase
MVQVMDKASTLITIFGGSGFVGRYVVQTLAQQGYRLRIAVRNPDLAAFLKPLGGLGQIQLVPANITHAQSVAAACYGAHAVLNLVGILQERGAQTFNAVQAQGAALVAQAATHAGARRFVQMSALGADGESPSLYARSKAMGENSVLAAFPAASILRPSLIFGPEDGFFNRFAQMAKLMPFMPVICGESRFQPVYVQDVAYAVAACLEGDHHQGQRYALGGPRVYAFQELLAYILKETQYDKPLIPIPTPVARLMANLTGWLPYAPLTPDQLSLLERDNIVENAIGASSALQHTGFEVFGLAPTPLEAIVPSYLVRYRPKGRFSPHIA